MFFPPLCFGRAYVELWRRKWQPTSVFLPGEFHAQRSLVGSSLWGHKESHMTEHACTLVFPNIQSNCRRQKENPENSLSCHSLGSKVSSRPVFFSPLLESYICLCPGLLAGLCRRRRDKYIYSILPRNQKSMICLFLNFI